MLDSCRSRSTRFRDHSGASLAQSGTSEGERKWLRPAIVWTRAGHVVTPLAWRVPGSPLPPSRPRRRRRKEGRKGSRQPRHALGGAVWLRPGSQGRRHHLCVGQLSHDDQGNMVAPAPLDPSGKIADHGNMGAQMAKATPTSRRCSRTWRHPQDNLVEEVVYVTDMDAAFAVAGQVRKAAFGGSPVVASTILVTPRLAFPERADRGQGRREGLGSRGAARDQGKLARSVAGSAQAHHVRAARPIATNGMLASQ